MNHAQVLCAAVTAVSCFTASSAPLVAQAPQIGMGAYAARHGLGIEGFAIIGGLAGPVIRYEGLSAEKAAWLGARLNIFSEDGLEAYVLPLTGAHYCYRTGLGGSGSGCDRDPEPEIGAAAMAGLDLGFGSDGGWSLGMESGYRFVDAGSRSRWTFAATVRYRTIL
jgi:hypothetical protein